MELVSIIVPVYNVEKYLRQCLDSLIGQTYPDIEIILVDDGSKDNCGTICDEYQKNDPRIKTIHKPNGGLTSAWTEGLKHTSEDANYVLFVDSDDWISLDFVKEMMHAVIEHNVDIVITHYTKARGDQKDKEKFAVSPGFYTKEKIEKEIYPVFLNMGGFEKRGVPITRWAKLFRKSLVVDNLIYIDSKTSYAEDLNICFPAMLDAKSMYLIDTDQCQYYYRINPDSMLHKYNKTMYTSLLHVHKALLQVCDDKKHPELKSQVYADCVAASVQYFKNELVNPDGIRSGISNISKYIDNSLFLDAVEKTEWHGYGRLNTTIIRIMKHYNWFNRNVMTRLLSSMKKSHK